MRLGSLPNTIRRLAAGSGEPDDALLVRYRTAGDEAAFTELVGRHGPLVWAVCRQSLPEPADAEDAFQATFLALARSAATVRGAVAPWLYAVAVRACTRLRRDAARRRRRERLAAGPAVGVPVPDGAWDRLLTAVHEAAAKLPAGPRAAFVLCDLQGLDPATAAARLGCSPGTLAVRRTRARRHLLDRLGLAVAAPLAGLTAVTAAVPDRLLTLTLAVCAHGANAPAALLALSSEATPMAVPRLLLLAAVLVTGTAVGVAAYPSARPEPPATTITGVVVNDADAAPVAGAEVRLITRSEEGYILPLKPDRTTSDAAGRFAFPPLKPGKYLAAAFAGGRSSRTRSLVWATVEVLTSGPVKPLTLRLKPGLELRATVRTADGKPVPGAKVRLAWSDHDRDHPADAAGAVTVPYLTAEKWHLRASGPGFAAAEQVVDLSAGKPAGTEFRLPPGGAVVGTVVGADRQPLAGVGISAFPADDRGGQLEYLTTGADGRFRFDSLPVGAVTLHPGKDGYDRLTQRIEVTAGGETAVTLTLTPRKPGGSVRGTVRDTAGKPVAGAELLNFGSSSALKRRAVTAADGTYRLDDVFRDHGGGHEFVVRAAGQSPKRVTFEPGTADNPATVDVTLDPGHRIAARVVDPTGKPVKGAQVYAAEHRYGLVYAAADATTGADGRFRFDNLPADCPISVRADGFSEVADAKLALDGDAEVEVVLKPEGAVAGRVVDAATGQPVPRFTVAITFTYDRKPDDPTTGLLGSLTNPGTTFAPADGRFRVGGLLTGMPLQVSVTADGYRRRVLRRVVAGPADAGDIALTRQDPAKALTVRGRVLDHAGKPAAGVELRLIAATDRPPRQDEFPFNWQMIRSGQVAQAPTVLQFQTAASGPDGGFAFRDVPDGTELELVYWGTVVPAGRVDHLEKLSAAERTALTVRGAAPGRVVGTLDRAAFPDVESVSLSSGGPDFKATLSADKSSFTVENVPAGEYAVFVYGKSRPGDPAVRSSVHTPMLARKEVTVAAGQEVRADITRADAAK